MSHDYTNNVSTRMLQAQMATKRKKISYNRSRDNTIINFIVENNSTKVKSLLFVLGVDVYVRYMKRIINSGQYTDAQKASIESTYYTIYNNLTEGEQRRLGIYEETAEEKIETENETRTRLLAQSTDTYYCYAITNGSSVYFIIKNFTNDEVLLPNNTYAFNLEHSSLTGTTLGLSEQKYTYTDTTGITLLGTPGSTDCYLFYEVPLTATNYVVYIYDKEISSVSAYNTYGYILGQIPVKINYNATGTNTKIVSSTNDVIISCAGANSNLKYVDRNGPKYYLQEVGTVYTGSLFDLYDENKQFGLYYGTYYIITNSTASNPFALLNNGNTDNITYTGDESKKQEFSVTGVSDVLDGSYNFYYGTIQINVTGDFGTCSFYSYKYGLNKMDNFFRFSDTCYEETTSYTGLTTQTISGTIEILWPQSRIYIPLDAGDYHIGLNTNNDIDSESYSDSLQYALYNGQYVIYNIPEEHPIAFINDAVSDRFIYSGVDSTRLTKLGPDDVLYNFYYGTIVIYVFGDFGDLTIYDYYYGFINSKNKLTYHASANIYSHTQLWDPDYSYPTFGSPDSTTYLLDEVTVTKVELDNYPLLTVDGTSNIVLVEGGTFTTDEVYTLNTGTYVIRNVPELYPIALVNNGITSHITYDGYFPNKLTGTGPDGQTYDYYHGQVNVYVNSDFGEVSIATYYNGFLNNGRRLIQFDSSASNGQAIAKYGTLSLYPQVSGYLSSSDPQIFNIDVNISIVTLPYSSDYAVYNFFGYDRNGLIDGTEGNPELSFYIGDVIIFSFSYTNTSYTFGIYDHVVLIEDEQQASNNNNTTNTDITWTPIVTTNNFYYYRSNNPSELMFNKINISANSSADLIPNIVSTVPTSGLSFSNSTLETDLSNVYITFDHSMNVSSDIFNQNVAIFDVTDSENVFQYPADRYFYKGLILNEGTTTLTIPTLITNGLFVVGNSYEARSTDECFSNVYGNYLEFAGETNTMFAFTITA